MTFRPGTLKWLLFTAGVALFGLAARVGMHAEPAPGVGPAPQRTLVETVDVQSGPGRGASMGPAGPSAGVPMAPGTGLIFGQTLEGGSSRPLAGVLVTLRVPGVVPLSVLSDGQGRFVFRELPKGTFGLDAAKNGYVSGSFGRMRPSGAAQSIALGEGERLGSANIPLWKYAAVSGTVLDESGEPMIGADVRVLRRTIVSGKPRLTLGAVDQTDDRGIYRIGTLEPGEYLVCVPAANQAGGVARDLEVLRARLDAAALDGGAGVFRFEQAVAAYGQVTASVAGPAGATSGVSADGRPLSYPTAYYPSAASASRANTVTLASGEERAGIDFQLRPAAALRVSGTVVAPAGPAANLMMTLLPIDADDMISPLDTATSRTDASGAFAFTGVAPGNYALRAIRAQGTASAVRMTVTSSAGSQMTVVRAEAPPGSPLPPLSTDPTLWADQPVSVGTTDLTDVVVSMRNGIKVTGQVEWAGAAARPTADKLQTISVTLEPADARTTALTPALPGRVEATGAFSTVGAPPGRYVVRAAGAPPGWFFRGATAGGRDVTDAPLEIEAGDVAGVTLTFTDKQTALGGTVTDSSGVVDSGASVIVFPSDRTAWSGAGASARRLRNVRTGVKGDYSVQGLPAGRYYIAAVRDEIAGEWQTPTFLETLSAAATTIDLAEGQTLTQPLRVVR